MWSGVEAVAVMDGAHGCRWREAVIERAMLVLVRAELKSFGMKWIDMAGVSICTTQIISSNFRWELLLIDWANYHQRF
jgi:hypothetical protein